MKKLLLVFALSVTLFFSSSAQTSKLYEAVQKNDKERVEKLLKKNANPNAIFSISPIMKVSALITAVNNGNFEIVRLLVENKAEVDWRDGFNSTALMYAAAKGRREIVEYLIAKGADVKAEDGTGNTVLTAAKEGKNKEVIALIENKLKE